MTREAGREETYSQEDHQVSSFCCSCLELEADTNVIDRSPIYLTLKEMGHTRSQPSAGGYPGRPRRLRRLLKTHPLLCRCSMEPRSLSSCS